jgi:hypothetical protein
MKPISRHLHLVFTRSTINQATRARYHFFSCQFSTFVTDTIKSFLRSRPNQKNFRRILIDEASELLKHFNQLILLESFRRFCLNALEKIINLISDDEEELPSGPPARINSIFSVSGLATSRNPCSPSPT